MVICLLFIYFFCFFFRLWNWRQMFNDVIYRYLYLFNFCSGHTVISIAKWLWNFVTVISFKDGQSYWQTAIFNQLLRAIQSNRNFNHGFYFFFQTLFFNQNFPRMSGKFLNATSYTRRLTNQWLDRTVLYYLFRCVKKIIFRTSTHAPFA